MISRKDPLLKDFDNMKAIDFIKINDRFTFIVLGDVMGKKWGAWFFSFSFLIF